VTILSTELAPDELAQSRFDTMQNFDWLQEIASDIRQAILPALPGDAARERKQVAFSGDTTFGVDLIAEEALLKGIQQVDKQIAYFSEDKGLVKLHPEPKWLLIADPIDGTRPVLCGFEGVISLALCDYSRVATFGSIVAAVVLEIGTGASFYSERGCGVETQPANRILPSTTSEVESMFWTFDTIGRPVQHVMVYLQNLIDNSGLKGAPFLINSAAYAMTRILTGQIDAHVDVGGRILQEEPESESEFRAIGGGRVVGTFPYDIAAAYLLLKEAGCAISDAFGRSLDDRFLIQDGMGAVMSCVAASNEKLHRNILNALPGEKRAPDIN